MGVKKQQGIYLREEVIEALRLYAFKKKTNKSAVIERALEQCIPEKYFREALKELNAEPEE